MTWTEHEKASKNGVASSSKTMMPEEGPTWYELLPSDVIVNEGGGGRAGNTWNA